MHANDPIAVCFATTAEAAAFRKLARTLGKVSIVITGMGTANAEAATRKALTGTRPSLMISSGFAGGLTPELPVGALLTDTQDERLRKELSPLGVHSIRFHCSTRIATTPDEKAAVRKSTGADAVEMESTAIHKVCREAGVPSITLRIVSDSANESLPLDFNALVDEQQNLSFVKLAWKLIRSPGTIPRLMTFQKQVDFCGRRLATAVGSFILSLRTTQTGN